MDTLGEHPSIHPLAYLLALRKFALLFHPPGIVFLLLLSGEVQRQAQRLREDVRLAGVLRQQREVDQLLLPVNAEDRNRKGLRLKIPAARQPGPIHFPAAQTRCRKRSRQGRRDNVQESSSVTVLFRACQSLLYLMILVVSSVLTGRCSIRTLCLLTKNLLVCCSWALPVIFVANLEERRILTMELQRLRFAAASTLL